MTTGSSLVTHVPRGATPLPDERGAAVAAGAREDGRGQGPGRTRAEWALEAGRDAPSWECRAHRAGGRASSRRT